MDTKSVLEADEGRREGGVSKGGQGLGEETRRGWARTTREARGKEKEERQDERSL